MATGVIWVLYSSINVSLELSSLFVCTIYVFETQQKPFFFIVSLEGVAHM